MSSRANDILLCNLPYVPDDYNINLAAKHEPRKAIFGGRDGLDVYRKLFRQLDKLPKKPLYILTESLSDQHDKLATIARRRNYRLEQSEGLIQAFELE
jgi:release factor glutamine methyltransferase